MYPRSLSNVSLCILNNWPFCSAEPETGPVAPVEATQVGAEGKEEVLGPTKPFFYYMSQRDTCLPHHNMTRLSCSPLQYHFAEVLPLTSSLHKSGEPLGPGASPAPLCALTVQAGFLQILLFPRGRLFSPVLPQSRYLSTHHLPSQSPSSPLRKWNSHPEVPLAPSRLHGAFPPSRAGWSWHRSDVCCDRPTKVCCVWTSIPAAMEGSLGRARHWSLCWCQTRSSHSLGEPPPPAELRDIQHTPEPRCTCQELIMEADCIPHLWTQGIKSPAPTSPIACLANLGTSG